MGRRERCGKNLETIELHFTRPFSALKYGLITVLFAYITQRIVEQYKETTGNERSIYKMKNEEQIWLKTTSVNYKIKLLLQSL